MRIFSIIIIIFTANLPAQDNFVNPFALELFIEGKTLELQDNYIAAIEKYNEALKHEEAAGIYYTLSKLYYNVSQYQKSLENGLEALKRSPDNLDYKENIADTYVILNDYQNALKYLKEVSDKKPDDINILYNVGRMYEALKQPSEALKYYERITEDFQYDETVLARMVEIYELYKDYANTAATAEKLLTLNPTDIQLKYSVAAAYLKIPDYPNALKIYEEILLTNPLNREVQTEIIKIYFRTGKNNDAFEKYSKLIKKDTIDFDTKINIAAAFLDASSEDPESFGVAKSIFIELNQAYPTQWQPEYFLGVIDVREKNEAAAETKFQNVLKRADTSAEAHLQVGFAYYERNKFEVALEIFKSGAEKFPNNFGLQSLTGNTHYRLGNQKESLPWLEKAKELNPSDINTLSTLGIIYDNLKMFDECDRLYEHAFKFHPDNILMLNNYAYSLAERGIKLKEALEMSKKTIDAAPGSSSYLDTYGWILYKMKDYKNAKIYIERAVKFGSNTVLLEHLGDVYEGLGEIVKALKYWNEAIKDNPDNKDLLYKIEKYK